MHMKFVRSLLTNIQKCLEKIRRSESSNISDKNDDSVRHVKGIFFKINKFCVHCDSSGWCSIAQKTR